MKSRNLCLDLFTERLAGMEAYRLSRQERDTEYRRMVAALRKAVDGELTGRQRECVRLCYYDGLTARRAAEELGVTESTVCRHLKKARVRLARVLRYSFPRLS